MIKVDLFENIELIEEKKLRGGYYTPQPIAQYITDWAITKNCNSILEPSCGDGVFIKAIINSLNSLGIDNKEIYSRIQAVELYDKEVEKIKDSISNSIKIHIGDFFKYCLDHLTDKIQFDCIVGNPPFIRYQDFPNEQRIPAFILMKKAGLNPNKLTNTWIPFLVASTLLLKQNGRIGMVLPAELFQVNYAAETRQFLSEFYSKIHILTFRKLVFSNIQQEVIVFLGEKKQSIKNYIHVFELNNIKDLSTFKIPAKNDEKELDHSIEKWTQYYLSNYEIELLRNIKKHRDVKSTGEFLDVDVGIVTGQNKFFVLSQRQVHNLHLDNYVKNIVGRANHLKGLVINNDDWDNLINKQYPNFLLSIPDMDYEQLPLNVKNYLEYGISKEYHLGYKCKIRNKWWIVPSIWIPNAFMLRQVYNYPKLILNKCNATSTDTLHRVKFKNDAKNTEIISSFINSLTFAFAEVTGRSYGGGVLTFEPTEAERLPLLLKNASELDFNEIDSLVRDGNITQALQITDNTLLKKGLGLTQSEIKSINDIWLRLSNRRINRR